MVNIELRGLQRGEGGGAGTSTGERTGERELVGIRILTDEERNETHRSALSDDPRPVFAAGVDVVVDGEARDDNVA